MSHQTDNPTQSAVTAEPAPQQKGPSPQSFAQATPQGAGDPVHTSAQKGHQGHHQYGQRSRDFTTRRNSHSRAGSGQANNGYRPRGGGLGGHRYGGAHSRGNSYHDNNVRAMGPTGSHGPDGKVTMYAAAPYQANPPYWAYPGSYPLPMTRSPSNQTPVVYPPFQMPQESGIPRPRVALSDANGNPIDIHAAVSTRHQHTPDIRGLSETPPTHSRSPSMAAPDSSEAEATVKKATTGGSAVENMKALIAARKKAKEAEAAKKETESANHAEAVAQPVDAPQEQTNETEVEKKAPVTTSEPVAETSTHVNEPVPEPKSPVKLEPKSEPKLESKTEVNQEPTSKPELESKPEPKHDISAASVPGPAEPAAQVKEEVPTETRAKPVWKSPAVARLEAEKAKAEAEATKQSDASTKPEEAKAEDKPKDEPKKAPWKGPTLMRLEAEQAKAAAERQTQSTEENDSSSDLASTSEPAVQPSAPVSEEVTKTEEPKVTKEETPAAGEDEKADDESKHETNDTKDNEEAELARVQAFNERLAAATRPTPEELESHTYPSSVIPNSNFGSGKRYQYTPDFLQQFEPIVPRLNHASVRSTVGFDFEFTSTGGGGRWGSGMGPRSASSRGPSRVGSFASFGRGLSRNASGAQSMRGRQGSRRRGDRQGSRRDRDDVTANGTPIADLPPLKKAENAWTPRFMQQKEQEVTDDGRLTPEEVQRKVKSLLNKMAWENFERISTEIREIALQSEKETTAITLRQIIQLTFEKAIDEPHWSAMYAQLFWFLHVDQPLPDTIEDHSDPEKVIKGLYVLRRYLLNMSQKEFEKGWNSIVETTQGAAVLSDEYYMAIAKKRRGLGLIQFVGELYKLSLISDRLLTSCFRRLMAEEPTEDIVESTSRLLKTVAPMILQKNGKQLLDMVMDTMKSWRESGKLAARLRFMIMDVEDLARKNWEGVGQDGPKTIAQVHEEAVKREQAEQRERARRGASGSRRGGDFGRSFTGGKRR